MTLSTLCIESCLSADRFGRFVDWTGGDRERALELYLLNCRLSESLYAPLHFLEVCLRNRISDEARRLAGGEPEILWFEMPNFQLVEKQKRQLDKAKVDLALERKLPTPGRIVAALSFSYWTSFLNRAYEPHWHKGFHRIVRRRDGKGLKRRELAEPLDRLRRLRNRIAHHEPILAWNLPKHHAKALEIIDLLSPPAAELCRSIDRFPSVYPPDGVRLAQKKTPAGEESAGAS